jgi:hypothetical protein
VIEMVYEKEESPSMEVEAVVGEVDRQRWPLEGDI